MEPLRPPAVPTPDQAVAAERLPAGAVKADFDDFAFDIAQAFEAQGFDEFQHARVVGQDLADDLAGAAAAAIADHLRHQLAAQCRIP